MLKNILFIATAVTAAFPAMAYPIDIMMCQPLSNRLEKENHDLRHFDNLVLFPLRQEKAEWDRLYDIEVNGPAKLAQQNRDLSAKNNALSAEISQMQAKIKINEDRAAELDRLGKPQKANELRKDNVKLERKIAGHSSQIERNNGTIDANTARSTEIQTTPPTRQEVELKRNEVTQKLSNEAQLKREKEEERDSTLYALDVCVAYDVLKNAMVDIKGNQGWQTDRTRCSTSWPSSNPGVEMARRDARMITGCP